MADKTEQAHRGEIEALQDRKLASLFSEVLAGNPFYRAKLGAVSKSAPTVADLTSLPFTTKTELSEDQVANGPFGSNLTYPVERYTRMHQTSGTTGAPMRWLDTAESWQWWLDCWKEIYAAAGVTKDDRVFVAFSFGPFIGFWTAFEAAQQLGALTLTGGAQTSEQRIATIETQRATVLVSTPTYALRLAEVAAENGNDLAGGPIRLTVHAGEPGASIPSVKNRLETSWGGRCVDHAGATEVGAWGYGCGHADHMHVNEAEFVAEVIDPDGAETVSPDADGVERGELVLTNLGRAGSPVIRYRTGDQVELVRLPCPCGRTSAYLRGGVLGRIDDMIVIRGINIFPSAVENVIREIDEIEEFQGTVERVREMTELVLQIEVGSGDPDEVAKKLTRRIRTRLNVRPRVEIAAPGSLPRYELKARRFKIPGR
ncbi:MAG: phenylacetate--CoA ligase family protein [Acidobacteriota bacterium]|nr:phenylacetate--CoA ligase family protein [Acidobacteriota bacterium]